MVGNITSLTGNGLRDWFIQRVTAVAIGVYTIFLLGFFIKNPNLSFTQWQEFFSCKAMQIAGTLVVVSIITHAWIGLWTVCTDYIKCVWIRTSVILFLLLAEAILLVWGLKIVWGI